jgi:hypothetical protein
MMLITHRYSIIRLHFLHHNKRFLIKPTVIVYSEKARNSAAKPLFNNLLDKGFYFYINNYQK